MTEQRTITEYVEDHGITVEVTRDRGMQRDDDGWEHHAYVLTLHYDGRTITTPWRQGTGIEDSPSDRPDRVLDSLISDATIDATDFEDFCGEFGYDTDSRKAYATWQAVEGMRPLVIDFVGGADEFATLAYDTERL